VKFGSNNDDTENNQGSIEPPNIIATSANNGNMSPSNVGKDKVMVYNSDSESEEGDPKLRVGSRFSSYHNEGSTDNLQKNKNNNIKEDIDEKE
jgi:hypothetical protein